MAMKDRYKTLKLNPDVHARLLTYLSGKQLANGGKRVTLCAVITELLDIAEGKSKK